MRMATIRELVAKQGDFAEAELSKHECRERLWQHMYDISGDASGSDPSLYLTDKEDQDTLEEFLELAFERNWVDSEPVIGMRRSRVPGVDGIPPGMQVVRAGLTKALFFPKVGPTMRGYVFAELNMKPTQQVAVCEDHMLYSERGPELANGSKGIGWGRLPDPEYMLAHIQPVTALLRHPSHKTLAESLISRILPVNLRSLQ